MLFFRNSINLPNSIRSFCFRVYLFDRVLELLSGSPPVLPQRSASLPLHLLRSASGSPPSSSPATVAASSSHPSPPRSTASSALLSSASTSSSATCWSLASSRSFAVPHTTAKLACLLRCQDRPYSWPWGLLKALQYNKRRRFTTMDIQCQQWTNKRLHRVWYKLSHTIIFFN